MGVYLRLDNEYLGKQFGIRIEGWKYQVCHQVRFLKMQFVDNMYTFCDSNSFKSYSNVQTDRHTNRPTNQKDNHRNAYLNTNDQSFCLREPENSNSLFILQFKLPAYSQPYPSTPSEKNKKFVIVIMLSYPSS